MTPDASAPTPAPEPVAPDETLTVQQQSDLTDAVTQERYRAEYLQQLRRQSCPGCGEGEANY